MLGLQWSTNIKRLVPEFGLYKNMYCKFSHQGSPSAICQLCPNVILLTDVERGGQSQRRLAMGAGYIYIKSTSVCENTGIPESMVNRWPCAKYLSDRV